MWGLVAGGLIFIYMSPNVPRRFGNALKSWPLLLPGVAAICMYSFVSIQPRYICPFIVLVLLGLFPGVLLHNPKDDTRRTAIATVVIATSVMVLTAQYVGYHLVGFPRVRETEGVYGKTADYLSKMGVRPGDAVGVIGDGWDEMHWARLARVRIVVQIPPEEADNFWRLSDPRSKSEVDDAVTRAGVVAIVAGKVPTSGMSADWQPVGDTPYYIHFLISPRSKR